MSRSRDARDVYTSILDVPRLAPLIVVVASALAVLETVIATWSPELVGELLFTVGPPTAGIAVAARALALRDGKLATAGPLVAALVHVLMGYLDLGPNGGFGLPQVFVTWTFHLAAVSPLLLVIGRVEPPEAHAAGDGLLRAAGVWWVALHVVGSILVAPAWPLFACGATPGLAAIAFATLRGRRRRAFCEAAARGEIPDHRVRPGPTAEELASLPMVFGPHRAARSVLERIEAPSSAYRDADVPVPVGLLPF